MLCSADSSLRHLSGAVIAAGYTLESPQEHALQVKDRNAKWRSGSQTEYSLSPHYQLLGFCFVPYVVKHFTSLYSLYSHHPIKAKKEEKHFRENEAACPKLKNRGLLFSQDGEIVLSALWGPLPEINSYF